MKHLRKFNDLNESLYSSVIRGEADAVKKMLDQGADISERRYMAIKQAINFGRVDMLNLILAKCSPDDEYFPSEEELKFWAESALDHTDEPTRKKMIEIISNFFN